MTMRVMSRPGRITLPGHVMTIVRNVVGADATNGIGRVRLLSDDRAGLEVSTLLLNLVFSWKVHIFIFMWRSFVVVLAW